MSVHDIGTLHILRSNDLMRMVIKNMDALIEEMKQWDGTVHEYTALIAEYNTCTHSCMYMKRAAGCWLEDVEKQWKARSGGEIGLKGNTSSKASRIRHVHHMHMGDY